MVAVATAGRCQRQRCSGGGRSALRPAGAASAAGVVVAAAAAPVVVAAAGATDVAAAVVSHAQPRPRQLPDERLLRGHPLPGSGGDAHPSVKGTLLRWLPAP